jgi:hypothetical protein
MQHYEPSATTHVVRKLLMLVVAFGTIIPNRPSVIMLFGCFQSLDFRIRDLLYINTDYLFFSSLVLIWCMYHYDKKMAQQCAVLHLFNYIGSSTVAMKFQK